MELDLSARINTLTMELVGIQSDAGTALEKDVENYLYKWLGRLDYFVEHPDHYGQYPLPQDPLKRSGVWGLLKGDGDQTVILMHHHDVVDAFDYGPLNKWAHNPAVLQQKLSEVELSEGGVGRPAEDAYPTRHVTADIDRTLRSDTLYYFLCRSSSKGRKQGHQKSYRSNASHLTIPPILQSHTQTLSVPSCVQII